MESTWVELDIQKGAKEWIQNDRNHGLVIQIENEDSDFINPFQYFSPLSCQVDLSKCSC